MNELLKTIILIEWSMMFVLLANIALRQLKETGRGK